MKKSTPTTTLPMPKGKNVNTAIVVKSLEKKAMPIIRKLENFKIRTNDDRAQAMELTKQVKALGREADQELAAIIGPIKLGIERAREFFKPFQEQVKVIDALIKKAILEYDDRNKSKKTTLTNNFEKGKIGTKAYLNKSAELEEDSGTRMVWELVPIDTKLTPREYLIPDEVKIKNAFKQGKQVKGWKWHQVKSLAI